MLANAPIRNRRILKSGPETGDRPLWPVIPRDALLSRAENRGEIALRCVRFLCPKGNNRQNPRMPAAK